MTSRLFFDFLYSLFVYDFILFIHFLFYFILIENHIQFLFLFFIICVMKLNQVYFSLKSFYFYWTNFIFVLYFFNSYFLFYFLFHSTYYRFTLSLFARPLHDKFPYRFPGKTRVSVKNVRVPWAFYHSFESSPHN